MAVLFQIRDKLVYARSLINQKIRIRNILGINTALAWSKDEGVLDAAKAEKLSVEIEPKIIIPMHFGEVGVSGALKKYLKEKWLPATK